MPPLVSLDLLRFYAKLIAYLTINHFESMNKMPSNPDGQQGSVKSERAGVSRKFPQTGIMTKIALAVALSTGVGACCCPEEGGTCGACGDLPPLPEPPAEGCDTDIGPRFNIDDFEFSGNRLRVDFSPVAFNECEAPYTVKLRAKVWRNAYAGEATPQQEELELGSTKVFRNEPDRMEADLPSDDYFSVSEIRLFTYDKDGKEVDATPWTIVEI